MFDCAYEPERQPEPAAMPKSAAHSSVWLVATLLLLAISFAAVLGSLASDYVMS